MKRSTTDDVALVALGGGIAALLWLLWNRRAAPWDPRRLALQPRTRCTVQVRSDGLYREGRAVTLEDLQQSCSHVDLTASGDAILGDVRRVAQSLAAAGIEVSVEASLANVLDVA